MKIDNRLCPALPLRHGCRLTQTGFTLVELVMVIIIAGVLAVYAAPRMFDTSAVNSRGFHDSTLAYLRYAQKTAIAQRRTVCVAFTSTTSLTLSMASAAGTSNCATAATLLGPKSENPATLTAASSAAYSATPANFNFDGLGQPLSSATGSPLSTQQVIQVVGVSKSITVEPSTGYVHE